MMANGSSISRGRRSIVSRPRRERGTRSVTVVGGRWSRLAISILITFNWKASGSRYKGVTQGKVRGQARVANSKRRQRCTRRRSSRRRASASTRSVRSRGRRPRRRRAQRGAFRHRAGTARGEQCAVNECAELKWYHRCSGQINYNDSDEREKNSTAI